MILNILEENCPNCIKQPKTAQILLHKKNSPSKELWLRSSGTLIHSILLYCSGIRATGIYDWHRKTLKKRNIDINILERTTKETITYKTINSNNKRPS